MRTARVQFASNELWSGNIAPSSLTSLLERDGFRWRTNQLDIMPDGHRIYVAVNQSNLNLLLLALVLALPLGLLWFLEDQRQRAVADLPKTTGAQAVKRERVQGATS